MDLSFSLGFNITESGSLGEFSSYTGGIRHTGLHLGKTTNVPHCEI